MAPSNPQRKPKESTHANPLAALVGKK